MEISEELRQFCHNCIYELAESFNKTLLRGIEYEACLIEVMNILSVPDEEQIEIFKDILYYAGKNIAGVSFHNLSPVNQFIVTIPPYVYFCLNKRLPKNNNLANEAKLLLEEPGFPRYLQEQIGFPVSQQLKGALWKPDIP